MIFRAAVKLVHRSVEVVEDRHFGFGIADSQNPIHGSIRDDYPVHITSRTMNADVVQGGETLAAEKVDGAQIENKLMGLAGVPLDEMSQCLPIRGVDVARNPYAHAFGRQVVDFEDGSAALLCLSNVR